MAREENESNKKDYKFSRFRKHFPHMRILRRLYLTMSMGCAQSLTKGQVSELLERATSSISLAVGVQTSFA